MYKRQSSIFFFKQKTAYEISACLVGSEMCIRDRYRVDCHLRTGRAAPFAPRPVRGRKHRGRRMRGAAPGQKPDRGMLMMKKKIAACVLAALMLLSLIHI